jgi:DNA-binding MarR family transcriptional regulator
MIQSILDKNSYLLSRACLAHRQNLRRKLSAIGLHAGQEIFLLFIWQDDGLTQSELGERVGVQPASVTRIVKRMERSSLIERRKDKDDNRVTRIFLTDKGWSMEKLVTQIWEDVETQLMKNINLEERKLLQRLLLQVYENAKS